MPPSAEIVLEVELREETGKNACRRIRLAGRVPGIVYGLGLDPFKVSVTPRSLEDLLKRESGRNTVFALSLTGAAGGQREAMIRELYRDPVTEKMMHVDFVRVDLQKAIQVRVPLRLIGVPIGVKLESGLLDFVHREVLVECLPGAIPEHIDVDVSELHINQHVSVGEIQAGEGVRLLEPPDAIVAVVALPKAEETTTEEAAAPGVGEPEVIKKGKEGETGEGGAKDK